MPRRNLTIRQQTSALDGNTHQAWSHLAKSVLSSRRGGHHCQRLALLHLRVHESVQLCHSAVHWAGHCVVLLHRLHHRQRLALLYAVVVTHKHLQATAGAAASHLHKQQTVGRP